MKLRTLTYIRSYRRHIPRQCRQTFLFFVPLLCGLIFFGRFVPYFLTPGDRQNTAAAVVVSLPLHDESVNKRSSSNRLQVASIRTVDHGLQSSQFPSIGPISARQVPPNRSDIDVAAFRRWKTTQTTACGGKVQLYANLFARLNRAVIDRNYCRAAARGGENVQEVINQDEKDEYYEIRTNCFQVDCGGDGDDKPLRSYSFLGVNYLNSWLKSLKTDHVKLSRSSVDLFETTLTIAITRHEYANLYHTLTDWYNAFLVMTFFGKRPRETNILLVDAHPRGQLDDAWSKLFNRIYYMSELPTRTAFVELVWGIQGYSSLIKDNGGPDSPPPLVEQFRSFFLSAFNVRGQYRTLNCSSVSVLFLWRHDYVAHPRNPSGLIQRKIANERQLLDGVQRSHPTFVVRGLQIDAYPMAYQLQSIADADVLIGMHGAGLAHVAFMPAHGALVEIYPNYFKGVNNHFSDLAQWRGMTYIGWRSDDANNEMMGHKTRIPVGPINRLLDLAVSKICRSQIQQRGPTDLKYELQLGKKPA